jgi:hypothetical protein
VAPAAGRLSARLAALLPGTLARARQREQPWVDWLADFGEWMNGASETLNTKPTLRQRQLPSKQTIVAP